MTGLMNWSIKNEVIMRLRIILSIVLITASLIIANDGFAMDVNLFAAAEGKDAGIAEIVWSVNRGDLKFIETESGWTDSMFFYIEILSDSQLMASDTLRRIVDLPRGAMISESYLLFDRYSVKLPMQQSYMLSLTLHDLGSGNRYTLERPFWMPDFSGEIALSGLALLSDVEEGASEGAFTHNGIRMLPNPTRIFGGNFPILYYYLEVYRSENLAGDVISKWIILNSDEQIVQQSEPETLATNSAELFILNGLEVSSLPPGKYYLTVEVTSQGYQGSLQARKSFTVPKPYEYPEVADIENVEQEYKYMKYFLTKSEEDLYKRLTEDGKHEFVMRFWEERDTTPDTPENKVRQDILERWHTANFAYDESGGEDLNGWKSDRGRVYIKFGKPNSIERNPIGMDMNPYEIWEYYDLNGGSEFVFADPRGINQWRLVHSTYPGEIYNPNWKDDLMNPHSTFPSSSDD